MLQFLLTQIGKLKAAVSDSISKINSIGDYSSTTESSTSVENETVTKLAELTPASGRYLIIANASFPSNATGARAVSLSTNDSIDGSWWQETQASPFGSTALQVVRYASFDGKTPVNLIARQTSGVSLDVTHRLFAIKLHE